MSKYIIESYKEFSDQYLKIQGEIVNLKTQIDDLRFKRSELLIKSREDFVSIFKGLQSEAHNYWHLDFDDYDTFHYGLYFKVKNRSEVLELIERLILTIEDFSTQNSYAKLELTVQISKMNKNKAHINTVQSAIYNSVDWDNVSGFEVELILVEDIIKKCEYEGKSPIEIISYLNKLEDAIEKNVSTFSTSYH
jgi:hypothetical protein